jgi:hypothetical protein
VKEGCLQAASHPGNEIDQAERNPMKKTSPRKVSGLKLKLDAQRIRPLEQTDLHLAVGGRSSIDGGTCANTSNNCSVFGCG